MPGVIIPLERTEFFNVFNHSNIVGRNGIYGNSVSGHPSANRSGIKNVEPGREFQFLLQVEF